MRRRSRPSGESSLVRVGALARLGLGYEALQGQQPVPGQATLNTQAGQLSQQSQQLESYLQTGTLPPGVGASLNQASAAAKAAIRSQYASMGMTGSSGESEALANVDQTTASQGANIAMQLLNTGIQESQLSASIYEQLMQVQLAQDAQLGNSISAFAIAASGGIPRLSTGG